MHSLLRRQLKRFFGEQFRIPGEWEGFIGAINDAYLEFDVDRKMLERSLDLSSQELLQANSEMRAVFQAFPDLLFRLDHQGTILSFKTGASKDLLLQPAKLFGKRIQDIPVKQVGKQFQEALQRAIQEKSMVNLEYSLVLQGREYFYEARLAPLPEDQVVAIIRNITARKRVEQVQAAVYRISEAALADRSLNDLYRSIHGIISELMPTPARNFYIALFDESANTVHFPYYVDEFDAQPAPRKSVKGLTEYVLRTGKSLLLTPERYKQLVSSGEIVRRRSKPVVDWLGVPLKTPQGRVIGMMTVHTYQTTVSLGEPEREILEFVASQVAMAIERKRTEEEARAARQRLLDIIDLLPDATFVIDHDKKVIAWNRAIEQMTGTRKEDIIGQGDHAYAVPFYGERRPLVVDLIGEETSAYKGNYQYVNKHGNTLYAEVFVPSVFGGRGGHLLVTAAPLLDAQGKQVGAIESIRDITERKQLEEQFRQSQKMEAFGQLASGVAHDFNNILTVISGNLSLMQMGSLPETELASAIEEANDAAERAANLTRQLLLFSHRQPMQLNDIDLNTVVASMTKMLRRLIGEHISLETHYGPGAAFVHADSGMMEQVLMNLAVNSRDAMPKGGKVILETATAVVDEAAARSHPQIQPGEYVLLNVQDTGCGIAPKDLPHIFEPFFTTKEAGKGTGLGLATVFGIIKQHQGWIEVESRLDQGTIFHIYLPRLSKPSNSSAKPCPPPRIQGGTETIFVVEDEEPVRRLMCTVLERHGYQVYSAASAVDALEIWRNHQTAINLLITDMVMPGGMNGHELADRLLAEAPGLKIIYCSGYNDDVLGRNLTLRRGENFSPKPLDLQKFLKQVRDSLDES
jgi:PAS domain S-box-containing protein